LSAPNDTSDANALEPCLHKVHVRGLDNLTTKDIRAFASEYFDSYKPSHIEWIDDTSANIVYETPEIAQEALVAFAAVEVADVSQIPALQTISAKEFPLHPQTNLEVRLAIVGDRKAYFHTNLLFSMGARGLFPLSLCLESLALSS
jgi:hypothetical protein